MNKAMVGFFPAMAIFFAILKFVQRLWHNKQNISLNKRKDDFEKDTRSGNTDHQTG